MVGDVEVYPADSLASMTGFLNEQFQIDPYPSIDVQSVLTTQKPEVDFSDVRGQEAIKRAMMIAAAGAHNILMIGPAGTGKTLMSKDLPGILPPMTREESLEVTRIYSIIGQIPRGQPLMTMRPVRTPHHTASSVAMIGGGTVPRPGEVSLAHHGVLFMDEMPEFSRTALETLRQPLEDGTVTIARTRRSLEFSSQFMLMAAMNPTPKGDSPTDEISRRQMERYLSKISGPLIDRIYIHVEVPAVPFGQLDSAQRGTDSKTMWQQVVAARQIQLKRNGSPTKTNSTLSSRDLDEFVQVDAEGRLLMKQAMTELGLSSRAYDKIRRVACTIADLEDCMDVGVQHVAEAIQYRLLDRHL